MTIIEDTRQQAGKHENIHHYCERHGIEIVRKKLSVGDYMLPGGNISVDSKSGLLELSRNLMNKSDHSRFYKECRRAREQGIKLIILCEQNGINGIEDVKNWSSKYSPVSGRALMERIYQTSISWGVEFIFCHKNATGRRLVELLTLDNPGLE
jgi:ERCC4-type nuclease